MARCQLRRAAADARVSAAVRSTALAAGGGDRRAVDVLVLGAGVIGLACALMLLRAGRSVRVLERGSAGCGSSHGNCGTITPSHAAPLAAPGTVLKALRWMLRADAPLYVRPRIDPALWAWLGRFALRCNRRDWLRGTEAKAGLLLRGRAALQSLVSDEGIDCAFVESGLWYVFRDAAGLARMHADDRELERLGIRTELLDAAAARAAEPALRDDIAGAICYPGDAMLRPDTLVAGLARRVREAGGEILEHAPVDAIEHGSTHVRVRSGSRRWQAPQAVLAGGAWSPALARQLGIRLPIQPGKGYSITYARPALAPRRPLVLKERSVCVTAWPDGFRLGSTMEFSGYDTRLNRLRLDALERGAAEYLCEPHGGARLEEWYGWRPMTWDDLPVIGAHPRAPRLLFATGHGMLGVSLSAITGELVAALATGQAPELDLAPFAPARFG